MSRSGSAGRRQRLSVVLMATVEARRLLPSIESVRDWAEEIVVLDESPQGVWRSLTRRLGVRWLSPAADLEPAEARRRALYQTDGEWLLLLAADERLDWGRGGTILRDLIHPDPSPIAWSLDLFDNLDPREPGVARPAARLVRKRPGLTFAPGDGEPSLQLHDRPLSEMARPAAVAIWRPAAPVLDSSDPLVVVLGLWRSGDPAAALERLREIVDAPTGSDPPDRKGGARAARLLSALLLAERQLEEAVDRIEVELVAVDPLTDPSLAAFLLGELGRAEMFHRHHTRAEACFERALNLAPRHFAIHAGRAEFLEATDRRHEAIESWLRAAALRPDLGQPRRRAGELLRERGRGEDADALIREADNLDRATAFASTWMDVEDETETATLTTNPLADLLKEFQPIETSEPEPTPALQTLLTPILETAPAPPLEAILEPAMAPALTIVLPVVTGPDETMPSADPVLPGHRLLSDPSDPKALEQRHWEAVAHLEEEVALDPDDHEKQLVLGLNLFSLREWSRAEMALRKAVRQTGKPLPRPRLAVAWCRLAECSLERGDLTEASREAGSALALDANSVEARLVLGRIAFRQHRFHEAAREFRRLLAGDNDRLPVDRGVLLREMGIALYRDGRHAEAAEALAKAADRLDLDAMLQLFLGNAQAHLGRIEAALESFRTAHRLDPSLPEARNNLVVLTIDLGNRHVEAGRHREALDLVAGVPATPEVLFLSAVARHALGDLPAARRELDLLNELDDNFAEAHWNLAVICRELGDVAASGRALARFRHLAPADPRGRTLEEALARGPAKSSIS
ncbi:MAG: tetratricopeptide repeat protein [Candidatus Eisenbacteria bacterium]|nr:tetratricopeptide repeat protein [Candidatus Eisenbacteria bacterium]